MLYTYTSTSQAVAAAGNILFNTTGIQTGCTAKNAGNGVLTLNRPGFYMINFSGTATGDGAITAQLFVNGTAYAGATATETGTGTGDVNLSFPAIVQVEPNTCNDTANCPLSITIQNAGVAATYTNAVVTVTKLC